MVCRRESNLRHTSAMRVNLERLWYLVQVVDHGGFSAAADELYMSQPSVSNQVRQLEASMHVVLVDRTSGRARPTAEGEVLVDYGRRIFQLADEAVIAIEGVQGIESGHLSVAGTTTVGTYLLPPMLARFRRKFPSITCDLHVANAAQLVRWIVNGEVGLGVFAGTPDALQLTSTEILRDEFVLVAAPGHVMADASVEPPELGSERFLMRERGSATRQLQHDVLESWGLQDAETAEIGSPETLKQAVRANLGLGLVSTHAVAEELADGKLAQITVDRPQVGRPVVISHREERPLSPAERAFFIGAQDLATWPDPV